MRTPPMLLDTVAVALLLALVGCSDDEAAEPEGPRPVTLPDGIPTDVDAGPRAQLPVSLQTLLGSASTRSGVANNVTCAVLDPEGVALAGVATRVEVQPDHGFEATDDGLVGLRAGAYRVRCVADDLGLRDAAGADWTVTAGPPARVVTRLGARSVAADAGVGVACEAFDDVGNPTTAAEGFTVDLQPLPGDFDWPDDSTLRIRSAGRYDVRCRAAGAEALPGEGLEVRPGPPVALQGRLEPAQRVYRPGQVVALRLEAVDAFDNVVREAAPTITTRPALDLFGPSRFRLTAAGDYTVTGRLGALESTHTLRVVEGGPGIECLEPAFGAQVVARPGSRVRVEGRLTGGDAQRVRVAGQDIPLQADGRFGVELPVVWGLNTLDVEASDGDGGSNSTFCAFFVSERWLGEDRPQPDAVTLRLGADAVDDGDPDRPLRSLGDALRRVVRSAGLRDALHDALRAQNPIVPTECRTRVGPVCVFSFGAEYRDLSLGGPHDLSLQLVGGGVRVDATLRDLSLVALMRGTLGNQGTFDVDRVRVTLVFDIERDGTRPRVRLDRVERLEVGDLSANFSGFLTGAVLNLAFRAFEGVVRGVLVDNVRRYLVENVDGLLTDLLDGFDLGALGLGFDVPSLTGGAPVRLTFDAALSTLDFQAARAVLGLQTRVTGPSRVAGASRGVPLGPNAGPSTPPNTRQVGAGASLVLVNQVLHALWRGGFFQADARALGDAVTGALPPEVDVRFGLPHAPAVEGAAAGTALRLHLGPAELTVAWPGVLASPITVRAAAIGSVQVSARGDDLRFEGLTLDEVRLAIVDGVAPGEARVVLEEAVRDILEGVLNRALSDGLPTLPIPSFTVPAGLQRFGLSPGTTLGLRQPNLSGNTVQWSVEGRFGE